MDPTAGSTARKRLVQYYFASAILEGLAALILLLIIPADPKNVWLFGYSRNRLALALALLGWIALFAWLTAKTRRDSAWLATFLEKLDSYVREFRWSFPLMLLTLGVMTFGHLQYLYAHSPLEGLLLRVSPFLLLLMARIAQTIAVFLLLSLVSREKRPAHAEGPASLVISPRKIAFMLGGIALLLVIASIIGDLMAQSLPWDRAVLSYNKKFNVDLEQTIPTYFSSVILLVSGLLLTIIAAMKKKERDGSFFHWLILAVIFWYMSMDETVSLHEFLIKPLRELFQATGVFYFAWVIVAIPLLAVVAISYWGFLARLPAPFKREILLAALFFVASALGLEMVGGWYFERFGGEQLPYAILTTLEETFEMAGIVLFIHALLGYLEATFPEIRLRFRHPRSREITLQKPAAGKGLSHSSFRPESRFSA